MVELMMRWLWWMSDKRNCANDSLLMVGVVPLVDVVVVVAVLATASTNHHTRTQSRPDAPLVQYDPPIETTANDDTTKRK